MLLPVRVSVAGQMAAMPVIVLKLLNTTPKDPPRAALELIASGLMDIVSDVLRPRP